MKKRIVAFVFALAMLALPVNTFASNPEKISDIFPNERFAQTIADSLKKNVNDEVSQDELNNIKAVIKVNGTQTIDSLEGIGRLSNVETLILHGTSINKIPSEIKNLTKLKNIDINASPITQAPEELKYLVSLERLDLAMNEIEGFSIDLSGLNKLKEIDLSQNKISSYTTKFPHAVSIKLNTNSLTRFPESLIASPNLEKLNLSSNKLENLSPNLDSLTKLNELDVNTNNIVERVPLVALKEGKIDKWSLINHGQYVKYDNIYLYTDTSVDANVLMPDLFRQLKEDSNQAVADWVIKKPDSTKSEMDANDTSEIDFNSDVFKDYGEYNIDLISKSKSLRYWGYSTYSTKVYKINHVFPKVTTSTKNIELYPGDTIEDFIVSASNGSTLEYTLEDDSIIEYNEGVIKGLKIGETKITFSAKDNYNKSKEVIVNVKVKDKNAEEKLTITGLPKEIFVGDTFKLVPSIDDQEGYKGWTYNKDFISTVYNQQNSFKALKKGETTLTYKTKRGTSKTLKVEIKERKKGKDNIAKTGSDLMILASVAVVLVLLVNFKKLIKRF